MSRHGLRVLFPQGNRMYLMASRSHEPGIDGTHGSGANDRDTCHIFVLLSGLTLVRQRRPDRLPERSADARFVFSREMPFHEYQVTAYVARVGESPAPPQRAKQLRLHSVLDGDGLDLRVFVQSFVTLLPAVSALL